MKDLVWRPTPLSSILRYVEKPIVMDDMTEYVTITVKRNNGGLEEREKLFGHQIKTKKQFQLIPGAFVISRVQCWFNAWAIVPKNIPKNMIASVNYDQFIISPEIDQKFFWWMSHSPFFTLLIRSSTSGVDVEKLSFDRDAWLKKQILVPPLMEQRIIANKIDFVFTKIKQDIQKIINGQKRLKLIKNSILNLIFDGGFSDASLFENIISTGTIQVFGNQKNIKKFYKDFQNCKTSISNADLTVNKETKNPKKFPDDDFVYVDISSLTEGPAMVYNGKIMKGWEAPSRARRVIHTDDIIFSTVRPYLLAIGKIDKKLDGQMCSTGFTVFSCGKSINPGYLMYQLCSPFFINQCMEKVTGGHYPAINDTNLRKLQLIVPPREIQEKIVMFLDKFYNNLKLVEERYFTLRNISEKLFPAILFDNFSRLDIKNDFKIQ